MLKNKAQINKCESVTFLTFCFHISDMETEVKKLVYSAIIFILYEPYLTSHLIKHPLKYGIHITTVTNCIFFWSVWDVSDNKGTCSRAWLSEFAPLNPHDGKKQETPLSGSLTSRLTLRHIHISSTPHHTVNKDNVVTFKTVYFPYKNKA